MSIPDLSSTVVAVFGPTASGKTAVAEALADALPAEIVSADSMQVYRGLPILTNQPQRTTALVGVLPLDREGSVAEYQQLAHEAIDGALAAGRTPIVAGGTGLYLRAAVAELDIPPSPPPGLREDTEREYDRLGPERAHTLLAERDPRAAATVHPNDRRRVVRALELHAAGASLAPSSSRLWSAETRHPTRMFGLEVRMGVLETRIAARTEAMFERGVEHEVAAALEGPIGRTASQIIGLREIAELPREEAAAAIALRTRQYAAYQRKWMRRVSGLELIAADGDPGGAAGEILARLVA
jgi:tRNA dimethylallyltransferase